LPTPPEGRRQARQSAPRVSPKKWLGSRVVDRRAAAAAVRAPHTVGGAAASAADTEERCIRVELGGALE